MWELDHEESWMLQNWCFRIVVLEKTLESPLDSKEIKPVHPKGNQSILKETSPEYSLEGLMLKFQCFGHLMRRVNPLEKTLMLGKNWGPEEKGVTEDEMVGWPHWLNGHEFEQALGDSEGHGSLACCSPWSQRVRHDLATAQQRAAPTTNSPKIPNR